MAKLYGFTGSTFSASFTCKDDDGDVVDLTGYTARSELRPSVSSSTLTLNMAPTIPTPTDGIVVITVTDETTAGLTAGTYFFDVVLDVPDGSVLHLSAGTIVFREQVTRV
jgi:hypothetical protein